MASQTSSNDDRTARDDLKLLDATSPQLSNAVLTTSTFRRGLAQGCKKV